MSNLVYAPITIRIAKYASAHIKPLVITLDVMLLPLCLMTKWLSDVMLLTNVPCEWTKLGLRCGTCGGTHCVNAFMSGRIGEAFSWNPFVFVGICYGLLSVVIFNIIAFGKQEAAKKVLGKMYSLTTFFVAIGAFISFTILRNVLSV